MVDKSHNVDDGLTGVDSTKEAIELQKQLQDHSTQGGFLLHKWNSSDSAVLQHIPPNAHQDTWHRMEHQLGPLSAHHC